jgi:hypothetical protein
LPGTNTLAYNENPQITALKSFIGLATVFLYLKRGPKLQGAPTLPDNIIPRWKGLELTIVSLPRYGANYGSKDKVQAPGVDFKELSETMCPLSAKPFQSKAKIY